MTGHSLIAQYQPRPEDRRNIKDGQRDGHHRYTSLPMPNLPGPFHRHGDSHFRLFHGGVTATLFYDRQCKMWTVRFDTPGIEALQFGRDEAAMDMCRIIIEEINRISPDWIPF